ncbi:MAG: geranylgeranylglycerol-phosphate geranylgeranyltransferase [Bacteroidetes bacterium]|nr:geranylgeranylglycerol-phosphate geranylgeranyltransferase [Bacteroidota bacterium]
MNSKKIKAYIQLSRPVNILITVVSIPVACWIAGAGIQDLPVVILAALTGALTAAGANAINDSFDIEIDKINRPDRPLPLGIITKREAQMMWLVVSAAAIGINFFINSLSLIIVILAVAVLYFYSARLKRTVLAGNITVAVMTGMAFIYGGTAVGHVERAFTPAVFAFLINFARELVKDVEDIEGDRKENAVTFPVRYGIGPALLLAALLLVILIGITFTAIYYSIYNPAFSYIVAVADISICISIVMMLRDSSSINMSRVSSSLKISMIIGLAAIITGSI